MSYQVSARRWRPQTFRELVGQGHVSRTLTNAITAERVAHAFLFTGVRGVGKTTAARILAKALNCEKGPAAVPCNDCTNCREITAGSAVDVLEIDGASNTGVDDVREIIENVRYRPAKCRYKIYIIDEVHMLSNSAFNALLKTLEEPPEHVKFIFATTDAHKLPATVQSRCQRFDFRRIQLRLVTERLREIVSAEGVEISDAALFLIAREGEGSMRDAQSLLDQVLAYGGKTLQDEDVLETLGIVDRKILYELGAAVLRRDPARALDLIATVHAQGYDMRRLTRDLVEHFRNLAVAKVTQGSLLPDLPDEERVLVREQAESVEQADCDRCFRILLETDEEIGRSPYPKLVLEMAMIKLASLAALVSVDEALSRMEEIEQRLRHPMPSGSGGVPPATPRRPGPAGRGKAPSEGSAAADTGRSGTGTVSRATAKEFRWEEFVAFVAGERPTLAHHLGLCSEARLKDDRVALLAPRGFYYDYLSRRDHVEEIETLAGRYMERSIRVTVSARGEAVEDRNRDPAPAQPSMAQLADGALENRAVRAAIEILGGELHEVRPRTVRRREDR